jgi:ComF family protein
MVSSIARLRSGLGALLAPPQCVLCDQPGLPGPIDLCAGCLGELPHHETPLQYASGGYELICCPWSFAFPVDELLRDLKFHGERSHARLLGGLLARARLGCALPLPQWVVPVPLHPQRLRERGYNQAAELARFAARELGLRCEVRCLERLRATREQTHLGAAERAANLRHAFQARRPLAVSHVALVDDVMTTGSTIAAAAAALRSAGARRIEIWVAAQAQRRERVHTM